MARGKSPTQIEITALVFNPLYVSHFIIEYIFISPAIL